MADLFHLAINPTSKSIIDMKYSVNKQDRYAVFSVQEDILNSVIAPKVKAEFVVLSNAGVENLILDISAVKYVDSSGLSAILTANRLWKSMGSFVLSGVQHPSVKKLIEISRLDTILTIVPTTQEGIEYVLMSELQREIEAEEEE